MTDGLLTPHNREEASSRAYIQAIAAGAGYVVATQDFDRNGVDVEIQAGGAMRPALALQLKATINLAAGPDGTFRYALKRRNYDLLRLPTQVPRLLALLHLPSLETNWLRVTVEELVLRNCSPRPTLEATDLTLLSGQVPESRTRRRKAKSLFASFSSEKEESCSFLKKRTKRLLLLGTLRALMEQFRTGIIR